MKGFGNYRGGMKDTSLERIKSDDAHMGRA